MFGDHQPSIENEFYEEVLGMRLKFSHQGTGAVPLRNAVCHLGKL